ASITKKCEQGTDSLSRAKIQSGSDRGIPLRHMKFSSSPDSIPGGHAGIDARLKLGPRIHPTACVVPGATVIGDVTLLEESSVWYSAVLRGDINRIIIGPRSNVQDNAVVHIDTPNETRLGELVTVGHSHRPCLHHRRRSARRNGGNYSLYHRRKCLGHSRNKDTARFVSSRFAGKSEARAHARGTKRHRALGLELCRNLKAFP